jgi:hypothetical protein
VPHRDSWRSQAVNELLRIQDPPLGLADLAEAVAIVDQELALIAIDEAIAGGGTAPLIARAEEDAERGSAALATGKLEKAIDHYAQAWQHARRAVADTPED